MPLATVLTAVSSVKPCALQCATRVCGNPVIDIPASYSTTPVTLLLHAYCSSRPAGSFLLCTWSPLSLVQTPSRPFSFELLLRAGLVLALSIMPFCASSRHRLWPLLRLLPRLTRTSNNSGILRLQLEAYFWLPILTYVVIHILGASIYHHLIYYTGCTSVCTAY